MVVVFDEGARRAGEERGKRKEGGEGGRRGEGSQMLIVLCMQAFLCCRHQQPMPGIFCTACESASRTSIGEQVGATILPEGGCLVRGSSSETDLAALRMLVQGPPAFACTPA